MAFCAAWPRTGIQNSIFNTLLQISCAGKAHLICWNQRLGLGRLHGLHYNINVYTSEATQVSNSDMYKYVKVKVSSCFSSSVGKGVDFCTSSQRFECGLKQVFSSLKIM